jgi:hypothetical protein
MPLGVEVSTVDALDTPGMGYCETMVFGGEYDQECARTFDRDDARLLHERVVARLAAGSNPWDADADSNPRAPESPEGSEVGCRQGA